jgi:hypothetical protein
MERIPYLARRATGALLTTAVLCLAAIAPAAPGAREAAPPTPKGQRVFVCGHSFHFFIAEPLAEMARAAGIKGHQTVGVQFLGGSRTLAHWNLPEEKNKAKQALRKGEVDMLTLSPIQHPDEGVTNFVKLGLENNPNLRVTVQASWGAWDGDNREFPKNAKTKVDRNQDPKQLQKVQAGYFKSVGDQVAALNKEIGRPVVFVVPVGQAVLALREKIREGRGAGLKAQEELFADPIGHGTAPLQALVAYCHFAVIYHRSPAGLPVPSILKKANHPEWNADLNRLLQEVAWEAVTHHPLSGVRAVASAPGR